MKQINTFVESVGRILKDEQTLKEYNITDACTVHLVKGKTAAAAGGAPTTGATTGASTS